MRCEKCAGELPDKKVICPHCGFNNALQNWQQQCAITPPQPVTQPAAPAKESLPLAARVRARYAPEAKLIPFPLVPKPAEPAAESPSEPDWRAQTKAKVREHLERRKAEAEGGSAPVSTDDPTRQLLVESALKRIRRSASPPPIMPVIRSGGKAQALAHALDYAEQVYAEALPEVEPLRQPRAVPQPVLTPQQSMVSALPDEAKVATETTMHLEAAEPLPAIAASSVIDEEPPAHVAKPAPDQIEVAAAETKKTQLWVGKPAPMWLRALAGSLDLEAAAFGYLPFFAAYTSVGGPPEGVDVYLMAVMLAVVVYLYQLITYSFNGRTLGMAICGLRCVALEDTARRISFKHRLRQALGGTVALLCPPLNLLATRFTEHQRGLADALAGTITLRRSQD